MYSRESFERVKEIIDARREGARHEAEARRMEIRMMSPEYCDIDDELRDTAMKIFKTACFGGDINPIKERNGELNARRRGILKSLGYPEDYVDVKYTCPECNDSGSLKNTKMCSCFKRLLITDGIKASGIGDLIERQSFENFNLGIYKNSPEVHRMMSANVSIAKAFAQNFGTKGAKGKSLLLIGTTGSGKTHISTAVAKVVIERGYSVIYDSIHNIITAFEKDKFKNGYANGENFSDKYLECDLLIIDDLGTEFSTPFSTSCIYHILNTRQNKNLSTVISTNFMPKDLVSRYDDRIYSRMTSSSYTVLYFNADDYRLRGDGV